jgi:hypothetical protein
MVMEWTIFVFILLAVLLTVLFPRAVKTGVVFVVLATLLACVSIADHLVTAI